MSDSREEILQAAAHCIAAKGVRGLRVLDVAKEAGVSSGLLYYHFDDRDGLLAATLDYINGAALSYRGRAGNDESPTERLASLVVDEIADDDEVRDQSTAWNEARAAAVFEPALSASLRRTTRTWDDDITEAVRAAQKADGAAPDADPEEIAVVLTALVEGISGRWLSGQIETESARSILRAATKRLLRP